MGTYPKNGIQLLGQTDNGITLAIMVSFLISTFYFKSMYFDSLFIKRTFLGGFHIHIVMTHIYNTEYFIYPIGHMVKYDYLD